MANNRPATPPAIDCHAHVFTASTPMRAGAWTKPSADASVERFLAVLAEAGVGRAVLAASSLHADNEYALCATERHPMLRTTVIVDPETPPGTLAAMKARGAVGIRLQWRNVAEPPDLRSREWRSLLERAGALGWHVELHDDARRLAAPIEAVLEVGVPLVVDHFGRPGAAGPGDGDLRPLLAALATGRTWIKLSAAFRLDPPTIDRDLARLLFDAAGPDRLLWGSDWPFVAFEHLTYADALADLARAVPDEALRERIGRNGIAFYFGDQTA